MSLTGLPLALVVPPINMLGLSLGGLALVALGRRSGLAVLTLGLGGLTVLSMPLVAAALLTSLERNLPLLPPPDDPPQAIVILSANIARSADRADLEPGSLTLEREQAGAALARRTHLPILVTGGKIDDADETLGAVMARSMAEDFHMPVRWIEPVSVDTWENAVLSAAILRAAHIHSIYLVTHAWHMRRALIAFAHTGITITAAPVRLDQLATRVPSAGDFIPKVESWQESYYALHEWIGCVDYALIRSSLQ